MGAEMEILIMKKYTQKEKEQINYAFQLLCSEEDFRPIMTKPFESGSNVTASNGKILAMCKRGALPIKRTPVKNKIGRCPNVGAVVSEHECGYVINIDELLITIGGMDKEKAVRILEGMYNVGYLLLIVKFCKVMGIRNVRCGNSHSEIEKKLYLDAIVEDSKNYIDMFLMPCVNEKMCIGDITLEEYSGEDISTHISEATAMYDKIMEEAAEKMRKAKEEYEKNNWRMYEIRMAAYHTIVVKADSLKEARRIANNADTFDWDDELDWEVDGYSETCRYDAEDMFEEGYYDSESDDINEWPEEEEE